MRAKTTGHTGHIDGLQMDESPAEEDGGDAEDLRMLQQFLSESYELRNNVVAGRLEFRDISATLTGRVGRNGRSCGD